MKKLVVIIGPTASGKSDLAIYLAKKYNGEIISADSRQIYRKLDLGTRKVKKDPNKKEFYSEGIRHYLLDIQDVQNQYTVVDFQKDAKKALKEIEEKNKLPIICGGTPYYIISFLQGWKFPKVKVDTKLREELNKKEIKDLLQILNKLNPSLAKSIEKNKRRIIRAIEVNQEIKTTEIEKHPLKRDILILGIDKDIQEVRELIKKRLNKRINKGMIKEINDLKKENISSQKLDDLGLEYRYINRFLENKLTKEQAIEQLNFKIGQFAKRQIT
ncbi:MAG: tRNA (adenosine(37)-N6)-dimethylallyltransferase MiaA [Candidatus Pacebacteria bacterium]|nr:tRNA (adenosine(37)-N6)-dimethylallyltransferase MiaA [Candidatus Paceibacterota bacterium]